MRKVLIVSLGIILLLIPSCKSNKKKAGSSDSAIVLYHPEFTPGPPALVFKPKKDYSQLVAVTLSEDKTKIVQYPDPADLLFDSLPNSLALQKGYYMDRRGVSLNTAFLDIPISTYRKLDSLMSLDEMYKHILEKDPFEELCHCGNLNSYTNPEQQLNEIIAADSLQHLCKPLKLK